MNTMMKGIVVSVVATTLVGCGASSGGSGGGGAAQLPGGHVPAELVGKWQQGSQSDVNFSDDLGSFSGPSGVVLAWQFTADGHYTFDDFNQSSLYSCTTAVLGQETGSVDFAVDTLTVTAVDATITSQDNCHARFNYRKPWTTELGEPRQYQWSLQTDPTSGRTAFVVTGSDGQPIPYFQPVTAGQ
jgi:hypothetical protein